MFKNRIRGLLTIALLGQLLLVACGPEGANAGSEETLMYLSQGVRDKDGALWLELSGFAYLSENEVDPRPIDETVCVRTIDHRLLLDNVRVSCAKPGSSILIPVTASDEIRPLLEVTDITVGSEPPKYCDNRFGDSIGGGVFRFSGDRGTLGGNYCIETEDENTHGNEHTEIGNGQSFAELIRSYHKGNMKEGYAYV